MIFVSIFVSILLSELFEEFPNTFIGIFKLIQNRFLILHHNISFSQLDRRSINNRSHIIENLYLVFYNYDILLVLVIDLVEIYQADLQTSQSRRNCYLSL